MLLFCVKCSAKVREGKNRKKEREKNCGAIPKDSAVVTPSPLTSRGSICRSESRDIWADSPEAGHDDMEMKGSGGKEPSKMDL